LPKIQAKKIKNIKTKYKQFRSRWSCVGSASQNAKIQPLVNRNFVTWYNFVAT